MSLRKLLHEEREMAKIFGRPAPQRPHDLETAKPWFVKLLFALEPESLTCDGELPEAKVREREAAIRKAWGTLEYIAGQKVSADEAWKWWKP